MYLYCCKLFVCEAGGLSYFSMESFKKVRKSKFVYAKILKVSKDIVKY